MEAGNPVEGEAGNALYSLALITLALSHRCIDGCDALSLSPDDTRGILDAIDTAVESIKRMVDLAAPSSGR